MTPPNKKNFEAIFRESYPQIVRVAYLVLGDWSLAEEGAQDGYVQLLAHWGKVAGYQNPGGWVRRVAIMRAIRVRGRPRATVFMAEAGELTASELNIDLRRAILQLSVNQRTAVVLHYLCDLPVCQVADALGCAEPTARTHLHPGRQRLAALLRSETYGPR